VTTKFWVWAILGVVIASQPTGLARYVGGRVLVRRCCLLLWKAKEFDAHLALGSASHWRNKSLFAGHLACKGQSSGSDGRGELYSSDGRGGLHRVMGAEDCTEAMGAEDCTEVMGAEDCTALLGSWLRDSCRFASWR
jgi:hypothetical protein